MKEPCNCGATDCRRCYPGAWKENILWDKYQDQETGQSYEEWLSEYNEERLGYGEEM